MIKSVYKTLLSPLYKFFFELAEGLNTKSHYHVNHANFGHEQKLVPIKVQQNRQIQSSYHQKFHS